MKSADCTELLQWALPRMGFRWPGFRKVRGQVCKRVDRRLKELGLQGPHEYRDYLESHLDEWPTLDAMCRITISRFYRDRGIFGALADRVLPMLAARAREEGRSLDVWSAGCASGEEPYSLKLLWELAPDSHDPDVDLTILASDVSAIVLRRGERARYPASSLKDLPAAWIARAFEQYGNQFELRSDFRRNVRFACFDLRHESPIQLFDLILCRNLAFTYFDHEGQLSAFHRLVDRLRPGAALVIGSHERLPATLPTLEPWPAVPATFRHIVESKTPEPSTP